MKNIGKETEFVEFKKTTSEMKEAMISISSMLNKNCKGTLYFGVKDSGEAVGQQISKETLRDISKSVASDIRPTIYPSIHELEDYPGVIEVKFFGYDRPYSCKGKFYIRSYDEDRQLDINELLKLINHTDSSNMIWEKMESDETIDDVDEDLLKEYIIKANKCGRINEIYSSKKEVLKKLMLINNNYLNNAGRVLFSKNKPLTLKLAVFKTDEKLSFIDIQRYEGNLFQLAKKGQEYIKEHINYNGTIINDKRVEKSEIPEESIREVVINSLCHSSFDETMNNEIYITPTRVVIFNPGSFPSGYEPKDFAFNGVESILRNPIIARTLYYSNDIDSWATGFRRVYTECKENNVKISYIMKENGFEFIFYRNQNIDEIPTKILEILSKDKNVSTSEISKELNISRRTIQYHINKLKEEGIIERLGSKKTGYWKIK